ncbi:MAG TPA: histidine phosphatase family protein [Acidimicrobiia bacterium]|nr:histidine phosphatase family protein [Acidimicrobiia bacterium]
MSVTPPRVHLVRHGATEWSVTGQHTGRTDIPLTEEGRRQAERLAARLARERFALVLVSPLARARETARITGFGDVAEVDPDLVEWDYGDYDGRTAAEIRRERPGWTPWHGGFPGGETLEEVAARADRVVARVRGVDGDVALFAHGHILRVIAARWLEQPPIEAARYYLATASLSMLGWERETPVIDRWNEACHLDGL